MKKKPLSLSKAYSLIEPGPVVMVTTNYNGKSNIMTMAWHMMVDFEPPLIACVMGSENYSFTALQKTKECVINVPSVELAPQVVKVGNIHGVRINKFEKFGLTPAPAAMVNPPLITECFANLECKVVNIQLAKKYNLFILEVVHAWIATAKKRFRIFHHWGNGIFTVDGKIIKLPWIKEYHRDVYDMRGKY